MTMRGISRFFAETLNTDDEFITLSTSLIGEPFTYFVNVDLSKVEVPNNFFGIVTFNDKDDKEVEKLFQTQFLIGINRDKPVDIGGITEEPTLDKLEQLTRKAYEVVAKAMRTFGIEGETNIQISYVNMYVPEPDGEDDLQMQVDIELEQIKFTN